MPEINAFRMDGLGNDFIIIYGEHYVPSFSKENIIKLCDRKYGIGADGVMLIKYHEDYDFEMQFYNPDGSSSFCGNILECNRATEDTPRRPRSGRGGSLLVVTLRAIWAAGRFGLRRPHESPERLLRSLSETPLGISLKDPVEP